MICPDCGHDNLAGTDACGQCGQDLSYLDGPHSKEGLRRAIMETPLREVGLHSPNLVSPSASVLDAIRLMQATRHGSVLVVEDGKLVGIFTERDFLDRLATEGRDLAALPIRDFMTSGVQALTEDDVLAFALHRMAVGQYRHIPVVRDGRPVGFVSVRGILRYLAENIT
jgi:CBS domain-containing protein